MISLMKLVFCWMFLHCCSVCISVAMFSFSLSVFSPESCSLCIVVKLVCSFFFRCMLSELTLGMIVIFDVLQLSDSDCFWKDSW